MASKRSEQATVEFEKILQHRGIVQGDVIGALAYLQLGRAAQMKDLTKARSAYQTFLTSWQIGSYKVASALLPFVTKGILLEPYVRIESSRMLFEAPKQHPGLRTWRQYRCVFRSRPL